MAAPEDIAVRWRESRLGRASRPVLDDLTDLAHSGDMMAAITDESVTIAWIAGGRTMTTRADRVHFTLGGCWAEHAVGTNALALAHRDTRPAEVFSAEHFAPMVHDWVCYSAPILDPDTGQFLGVLDLSTEWQKAHPALLSTVSALARCIEYELETMDRWNHTERRPPVRPEGIVLRTLGTPSLAVDGSGVMVTPRQLELLTVLSFHPVGLGLDELTGRVYGDRPVSPSTVKAELSHLRHQLGGRIGSRPYRLVGPVDTDHHRVLDALTGGDVAEAVRLYRGPLLAHSESPDIEAWRRHIDVAVRDAVLRTGDPELLWSLSGLCEEDAAVHSAALVALDPGDARCSVVTGRLAAAQSD
jgi:hypothetical protein